jgi:transcriptional regulator with XRE-family HTH domain
VSLHTDSQIRRFTGFHRDGQYLAQCRNDLAKINLIMGRSTPSLVPRVARLLDDFGALLKLARLRRKLSAETVAQRAGITRRTLSKVEKGDSAVALGVYARVMQALRLENDLALLAKDDELGRKLQEAGIVARLRAPKRSSRTVRRDNENFADEA